MRAGVPQGPPPVSGSPAGGPRSVPVLILGAGLSGLSVARAVGERLGRDAVWLLERSDHPGGLCHTRALDGFHVDGSPHIIHIRSPQIRAQVESEPERFARHTRRAVIRVGDRFVPYPIELHLGYCDPADRQRFVAGLLGRPHREVATFDDWMEVNFGAPLADAYFRPYNRKIWATDPQEMGVAWMGGFVPQLDAPGVAAGLFAATPSPAGYNAVFWYPTSGGVWEYARRFTGGYEADRVAFSQAVAGVDLAARTVTLADGVRIGYDVLVSTIPLPELLRQAGLAPAGAQPPLRHTRVAVLHLGFDRAAALDVHWVYLPQPDIPCYRMSVPSNYSATVAPAGCGLLSCEVVTPPGAPAPGEELFSRLEESAKRIGLYAPAARRVFAWAEVIECAYPIPLRGQEPQVAAGLAALRERGALSVGRNGAWLYSSMEEAILLGERLWPEIERRLA